MKRQHMAKSHRAQVLALAPAWTNLMFRIGAVPRRRFYSDADGTLESRLYLPIEFDAAGYPAMVRVRLVRDRFRGEPIDPTAYDERLLVADDGFARLSFVYQGRAEKGRRYYWQAQVHAPDVLLASATGTHYADWWRR